MPKFKGIAIMTVAHKIIIEADTLEEAQKIFDSADGGDFEAITGSESWENDVIEQVYLEEDFDPSNELVMYRENDYDSYEDAAIDGAIYRTGSTMDDLETTGGSSIGFDLDEVIKACIGGADLKGGILSKKGEFVEIPFNFDN